MRVLFAPLNPPPMVAPTPPPVIARALAPVAIRFFFVGGGASTPRFIVPTSRAVVGASPYDLQRTVGEIFGKWTKRAE